MHGAILINLHAKIAHIILPLLRACWAREKPKEMASPFVTPLLTIVGLRRSKLVMNPEATEIENRRIR